MICQRPPAAQTRQRYDEKIRRRFSFSGIEDSNRQLAAT